MPVRPHAPAACTGPERQPVEVDAVRGGAGGAVGGHVAVLSAGADDRRKRHSTGALGLELTERHLARRIDDVAKELAALHDLGVLLAVDDFGTGYASLDYLGRFVFDEIKIDWSFVSGHPDRTNAAVTASIVALGRHLGLEVVAEGVETADQHERVTAPGGNVAQGYLMHRPAPGAQITDLLVSGDRFSR